MKLSKALVVLIFGITLIASNARAQSWIDLLLAEIENYQKANRDIAALDRAWREYEEKMGGKATGLLPETYEGLRENAELDRVANKLKRMRNGDPVPSLTPQERQIINKALEDGGGSPARSARIDQIKAGIRETTQESASYALERAGWERPLRLKTNDGQQMKSTAARATENTGSKYQPSPASQKQITAATMRKEIAEIDALAAIKAKTPLRTQTQIKNANWALFALQTAYDIWNIGTTEPYSHTQLSLMINERRNKIANKENIAAAQEAASRGDHSLMEERNRISAEIMSLEQRRINLEKQDEILKERKRKEMTKEQYERWLGDQNWLMQGGT